MRITSQKGFSGIDERADFRNDLGAASVMKNFRVTDSGSLTRRQGIAYVWSAENDIDGIWCGNIANKEMVIAATGGLLYRITPNMIPATAFLIGSIGSGSCMMFEFGGVLYIKSEGYYGKYDGTVLSEVEGYIPLVAMSCSPSGEGELFEQINLICDKRRQLFSGDGSALVYCLAEQNIDSVIAVNINGKLGGIMYSVDNTKGQLSFQSAPPEGLNNIEIIYSKSNSESDRNRIMGCTKMMHFGGNSDGRIFLWGNADHPNYRFYSELADGVPSAEYFPINAFTIIGNSKINCIVQQYDKQLIFTENEAYYSYCEIRDDGMGNTYSSFPVFSLNNGKGCIFETSGCVVDNKPVTLCLDGLNMWESTSVQNEKNASCFSMPIHESMRKMIGGTKSKMRMFDFQANRELYFIYDTDAYIYNYGNGTWYSYDDFGGENHSLYGRTLYFSRGSIIYAFGNEINSDLERVCVWESAYITAGNDSGRCDVVRLDADMHIQGNVNIRFELQKSGCDHTQMRELSFPEDSDRYLRVTFRPAMKRTMPFRVIFTDNGPGRCTLHGIIIKTREKERSSRDGVL